MTTIQKLSVPGASQNSISEERAGRWYLDRRIPIAMVFALFTQTGAALLWAGAASERLNRLEEQHDLLSRTAERVTRMEEQMIYLGRSLDRIERKLERFNDPPPSNQKLNLK